MSRGTQCIFLINILPIVIRKSNLIVVLTYNYVSLKVKLIYYLFNENEKRIITAQYLKIDNYQIPDAVNVIESRIIIKLNVD